MLLKRAVKCLATIFHRIQANTIYSWLMEFVRLSSRWSYAAVMKVNDTLSTVLLGSSRGWHVIRYKSCEGDTLFVTKVTMVTRYSLPELRVKGYARWRVGPLNALCGVWWTTITVCQSSVFFTAVVFLPRMSAKLSLFHKTRINGLSAYICRMCWSNSVPSIICLASSF